jgi:hypothetical protein
MVRSNFLRRRSVVSDRIYLFLQVSLITVLSIVDGAEVLVQHREWLRFGGNARSSRRGTRGPLRAEPGFRFRAYLGGGIQ